MAGRQVDSKILIFVALLMLINGGLGYAYFYDLSEARAAQESQLEATKSAVQVRYAEVAKMKEEFVLLQSQLRGFKELEFRGFFDDQNRANARDNLSKLCQKAGLLKAKLEIGQGVTVSDPLTDAAVSKHMILKSSVKIATNSLDDVDMYTFLKFLHTKYPGYMDIREVSLKRTEILNAAMLRKIGGGDPTPLVQGNIVADWYTMTPKDSNPPSTGGN